METTVQLIQYHSGGEWHDTYLEQRPDGLWRYEFRSRIQGQPSGQVMVLRAPAGLNIIDEADLDTPYTEGWHSKAEYLIEFGEVVRCLRRGHTVGQ